MVKIRIQDHTPQASTYADGQTIFLLLLSAIKGGQTANLSFEGILAVPSAFINAAVIQLVEHVSIDEIRSRLVISDSTKAINDLIRSRLQFVLSEKDSTIHPAAHP